MKRRDRHSVPGRVHREAVDGLLLATGHFRNGIMLAPITADAVAASLAGRPVPASITPADPARSSLVRNTVPNDEPPRAERSSVLPHAATSDERTTGAMR